MKKIRIGCGSGGCAYERIEPAIELVCKGNIDYLVFECLSERTITDAQKDRIADPAKGYNPMLQERMSRILPLMRDHNFKIVSNMGGANAPEAVRQIEAIAKDLNVSVKIAMVEGDNILPSIHAYDAIPLFDADGSIVRDKDGHEKHLEDLQHVLSANVYLGSAAIRQALDEGADIVVTGRVADVSLFMGPLLHEFNWSDNAFDLRGQGLLTGHLMECCTQLTGGCYADPGVKDVKGLARLGHPIAEVSEDGAVLFTKVEGSGGFVSVDTCKEQMLYEIGDPSCYLTPDGIADFSHVSFEQVGTDRVRATGATSRLATDTYKANVGYLDSYLGVGAISFGGSTALDRARLCADVVQGRWHILGLKPLEKRIDFIGYDSLYGETIARTYEQRASYDIRLRIAVRASSEEQAKLLIREMQCLYINGPAGAAGIRTHIEPSISLASILVPCADIGIGTVKIREV
jgi:hypothetical protein